MILARDIMSDHVVVIYDDMLVKQVAHLLLRDRFSAFPVVNKGVGLTGIITMTDLFHIISDALRNRDLLEFRKQISAAKDKKVSEFMSRSVVTINPETTLDEIMHMTLEQGIHTFPVLEEGKLIGIVSRHDILNAVFAFEE